MPRTKYAEGLKKHKELTALIWGNMTVQGMSVAALAKKIGLCPATIYNRKENPGAWTVEELIKISYALAIPVEDIRSCIRR